MLATMLQRPKTLLLAVPVAVFLVVLLLLQTPFVDSFVQSRLRQWVHPSLQVNGPVQIDIIPSLRLRVADAVIPAANGGHPVLTVAHLRLSVPWGSLFGDDPLANELALEGVRLYRQGDTWEGVRQAFGNRVPAISLVPEPTATATAHEQNQLVVRDVVVKDLAVIQVSRAGEQAELIRMESAHADIANLLERQSGAPGSLEIRQLAIYEQAEFGAVAALLEQFDLQMREPWVLQQLQATWDVKQDKAHVKSVRLVGEWGEISADQGVVDLQTAELSIPMTARLVQGVQLQVRGVHIKARQSTIHFQLSGKILDPGVVWQLNTRGGK